MKNRTGETPAAEPPTKNKRASISVSSRSFNSIEQWCRDHDVPISAVVEILAARAIGMPLTDLPKRVQRWIPRVPG